MQLPDSLSPSNTVIVLVSFEGPDPYSQAGGLGVRVASLASSLAEQGYETHIFFIGDPHLPGEERRVDGRLVLHRWSQWISAHRPGGVYDGEETKLADLTTSLPRYLVDRIAEPAILAGKTPVFLFEEWQTADAACLTADVLKSRHLGDLAIVAWNANNPYSFERIDWQRLSRSTTVTAVSQYMRGILRARGVDALVIPNGIPGRLIAPIDRARVRAVRTATEDTMLFFKMARWEREKGWYQALEAVHALRDIGRRPLLVARAGGPSGHGSPLAAEAEAHHLRVMEIYDEGALVDQLAYAAASGIDVVSVRFGIDEATARVLYAASHGVLANSVSEPFGLVGLEAMAAGGIVYTGGTGEDYAVSGQNAVVLDTLDPREIVARAEHLAESPATTRRLRRAARATAQRFTWDQVTQMLIGRLEALARRQGLLAPPTLPSVADRRVKWQDWPAASERRQRAVNLAG